MNRISAPSPAGPLHLAILSNPAKSGSDHIFGRIWDVSKTAVHMDYLQLKLVKLGLTCLRLSELVVCHTLSHSGLTNITPLTNDCVTAAAFF